MIICTIMIWFSLPTVSTWREFVKAIGEAAAVAGVLSLAVDPFIKKRMVTEASKGIFKHMVGFDLEPEIKDRLADIVFQDAKLLCRRRKLEYRIEPLPDNMVRVTVTSNSDIETPGSCAVPNFQQFLTFERAEHGTVHRMSLIAPKDARQNYDYPSPCFEQKPPSLFEVRSRAVTIRPKTTYQFYSKYSMVLPEDFYHASHVGYPTIGTHLSVEAPDDFIVEPDETANHEGNEWDYPGLFMPGHCLTVRWRHMQSNSDKSHT